MAIQRNMFFAFWVIVFRFVFFTYDSWIDNIRCDAMRPQKQLKLVSRNFKKKKKGGFYSLQRLQTEVKVARARKGDPKKKKKIRQIRIF
jgi:hypothetical protein